MTRRGIVIASAPIFVFLIGPLSATPSQALPGDTTLVGAPARAATQPNAVLLSDAEINGSLDALAKLFAGTMANKDVRRTIHDAAARRFGGDTEVLWTSLTKDPVVRSALAGTYSRSRSVTVAAAGQAIDGLASIPRLQIAVRGNLDTWDPDVYTPLVASFPEGVDDTRLKTVTAYDASGQSIQLDAQEQPKRPVVVVGLNERTDDSGALLSSQESTKPIGPSSQVAATYAVRMVYVGLVADKEPALKGAAEISFKARSRGCSGVDYLDTDMTGLDHDGDTWSGPRPIGNTSCDVVFGWWEDDGGAFDYTLGIQGFSLGVAMDDSDDIIGREQVPHRKFSGGSDSVTGSWSALVQVTD